MIRKSKAKPEDPLSVGHHDSSIIYGYDVLEDGSVRLCDATAAPMANVIDRCEGLLEMQRGISIYVAAELAKASEEKRKHWDTIFRGLGLERSNKEAWSFNPSTRTVKRIPQAPDEPRS